MINIIIINAIQDNNSDRLTILQCIKKWNKNKGKFCMIVYFLFYFMVNDKEVIFIFLIFFLTGKHC